MRRALTLLGGFVLGVALLGTVASGLLPAGAGLVLGVGLFLLLLLVGRHGLALSMLAGFVVPGLLAATVWSLGDWATCASERPDGSLVEHPCAGTPR